MKSQQRVKGFTLLEILLVLGVAAALLVGGLWASIAVKESHYIAEIIRLTNMIRSEVNRLRFAMAIDDNRDIETLLLIRNRIPHRFVDEDNNEIMSPYATDSNAITVFARPNSMTEIGIAMPPGKVVALYGQFPVNSASDIAEFRACGITVNRFNAATIGNPTDVATACGASKDIPSMPNVFILYAQQ